MQFWLWTIGLLAAPFLLWALHRFCLRLEERGYLYYLHKKPSPGGPSVFFGMQEFIQPNAHQIVEALENRAEKIGDEGATGDPPHHIVWDPRADSPASPAGPDEK